MNREPQFLDGLAPAISSTSGICRVQGLPPGDTSVPTMDVRDDEVAAKPATAITARQQDGRGCSTKAVCVVLRF